MDRVAGQNSLQTSKKSVTVLRCIDMKNLLSYVDKGIFHVRICHLDDIMKLRKNVE